jgi:hypothetical protein
MQVGSRLAVVAAVLLVLCSAAPGATIVDPGQGPVALAPGTPGAAELSGLAYAGAGRYYAVTDSGGTLFELVIPVDATSGEILSASVVNSLALAAGTDLEGLVQHPLGGSVFVSDETGPAIREYRLTDGAVLSSVTVPAIFSQVRNNLSLESLAMRVGPGTTDDALWTANEESLLVDGPVSTASAGTVVRLQRFDKTWTADGQWAYVTDPYPGAPFLGLERSGVADLLALPNGELLLLERSFSSSLFRARIYQVDFAGATDTSALASLAIDPYTPVGKTLLWEVSGVSENYEGLAVGPQLDAGDWSLLLVSDSGGGTPQSLYPLRVIPEPGVTLQLAAGLLGLWLLRRRRR